MLQDALLFGLLTGMRGGDGGHMAGVGVGVVSLQWAHIDLEDKTLTIEPKTKDELVLPISTAMETILLRRRAATNGPWVFPNPRAKSGHLLTMRKPKRIFRSGHNLRHSFEALAKHAGGYQEQIDALTGHAGQGTTAKFYQRGGNADIMNVLRPVQEKISAYIMARQHSSDEVPSAVTE